MKLRLLSRPAALLAVAALWAGAVHAQGFTLWATETPAGGTSQYALQLKGGVRSYVFDGLGYGPANYSAGTTIPAASLNDPSSLTLTSAGSLLIADRGFNTGTGAVSLVSFTAGVPNPASVPLAGIDTGPHQTALTAGGGLVVSSLTSGGKLYPAVSTPATVSFASGAQRGAVVNGSKLYSTSGSGSLQTFDVTTGALSGSFAVTDASLLHYGTLFGGSLWLADIGAAGGSGGGVYRVTLDGSGMPTASARVANVDGAIAIAFSPAGDEMLVADHYGGRLVGFAVGGGSSIAASPNLTIDGGTLASWGNAHVQFGGLAITSAVPEPGAVALMLAGLGVIVLLVMRRPLKGADQASNSSSKRLRPLIR